MKIRNIALYGRMSRSDAATGKNRRGIDGQQHLGLWILFLKFAGGVELGVMDRVLVCAVFMTKEPDSFGGL